jgi:hypothetical protein
MGAESNRREIEQCLTAANNENRINNNDCKVIIATAKTPAYRQDSSLTERVSCCACVCWLRWAGGGQLRQHALHLPLAFDITEPTFGSELTF